MIVLLDASSGAPNELTGFRIGSITKLFTALQTLMLRDSGAIKSLDDNITNYFPEFSIQYPWAVRNNRGITFRQLMSHMSGLPRNAPCKGIFQSGCSISDEEMNKNIAGLRLMYPPGTQPAYSNLGFGLLGKVLARITKSSSWTDLFSKMIGGPLNMEDTGNTFGPSDLAKMTLGYYHDGSKADLIDIGWDAAAGQSYSSTADLAKLMSVIFSADRVSSRSNVCISQVNNHNTYMLIAIRWSSIFYRQLSESKGFTFGAKVSLIIIPACSIANCKVLLYSVLVISSSNW